MGSESRTETHPSYGVITITNVTHGAGLGSTAKWKGKALFGSSILHDTTVNLAIHKATLQRDVHHDWIHPEDAPLIEVEMSSTQFAEAITSIGNASGTPITIVNLNGQQIPDPPFTNKRIQIDSEFEEYLNSIGSKTNLYYTKIGRILAKPNLGKKDRDEIRTELTQLQQAITSNLPFIKEQFSEQMDATVQEAKSEFESFIEIKLQKLGLEGFKKELAKLRSSEVMQLSTRSSGD